MKFLPFDRMWERVEVARQDSDTSLFFHLMYFGEMLRFRHLWSGHCDWCPRTSLFFGVLGPTFTATSQGGTA